MTTRTTSTTVTFAHPFILSGLDREQPAGSYVVETDEELLQGLSFPAYRWVASWIRLLPQPGSRVVGEILGTTPAELNAALARDVASGLTREE